MKTALVLSAGGMYGAYQAGVWSELESIFEPDLVVGASIGCLNGWLIAGGVTGSELEQRWMNLDDLSEGFLKNQVVERWIRSIHAVTKPRCEYALVTTELTTMRPHSFRWPDLEWNHLAASCAVPVLLKPRRICDKWHTDGGLVDPLPVWAALELGAERLITVNLLAHRPLLVRAAARGAAIRGSYRRPDTKGLDVLSIEPSCCPGSLRDAMCWSRSKAEALIEMGRRDTRQALAGCQWLGAPAAA